MLRALREASGASQEGWAAQLGFGRSTVQRWESGDLPDTYARRALKKVADELGKGPLPEAAEPVDELRHALERGDRETVRRLAQGLSGR